MSLLVPEGTVQKLQRITVFHVTRAGYWLKFSTSNNFTSLNGHWLKYRRCARLIEQKTEQYYISIRINVAWIAYQNKIVFNKNNVFCNLIKLKTKTSYFQKYVYKYQGRDYYKD